MEKHVLITGGAGFIGSHLCDVMLERGYVVTALDCLSPQVHGQAEVSSDGWPVYLDKRVRRITGDILTEGLFQESLQGVTHLVHLAASVGVGQSMTNIVDYTRNNVMSAAVMLEALSRTPHTVERIAVASSMSVYGEGEYRRLSTGELVAPDLRPYDQLAAKRWDAEIDGEVLQPVPTREDKLLRPGSIYAVNKRDHEEMFLAVGRALQIPTVALRLFNVYGSRQALSNPYTGVAAIFISRLLNDQAPLVFEDGNQMRDFVHVADVARAFATVLESNANVYDYFNVGSGQTITINEMALVLDRALKKNISPEFLNKYRVGDIRHCFGDISKIEKAFGFRPSRLLEDGMAELIEWVSAARKPVDRSATSMVELQANRLLV